MSPPQKLAVRPVVAVALSLAATAVLVMQVRQYPESVVALLLAILLALNGFLLYHGHVAARQEREVEAQVVRRTAELSEANTRLKELCLTDTLTGLPNRRYVFQSVDMDVAVTLRAHRLASSEEACAEGNDLVFYVLDLDDFKSVNDGFGHAAGDGVLRQVAGVLVDTCRASDLVVRWGGEEFLVVSRHVDRKGASAFAERIRQAVRSHIYSAEDGRTLHQTCSVGFAAFPFLSRDPEGVGWDTVLGLADQACYAAKWSGRDAWVGVFSTPDTVASAVDGMRAGVTAGIAAGTLAAESSLGPGRDVDWAAEGRETRVRAQD